MGEGKASYLNAGAMDRCRGCDGSLAECPANPKYLRRAAQKPTINGFARICHTSYLHPLPHCLEIWNPVVPRAPTACGRRCTCSVVMSIFIMERFCLSGSALCSSSRVSLKALKTRLPTGFRTATATPTACKMSRQSTASKIR